MDTIIDTASYIIKKYREITGENLDKMKLHKLLYFTQREAFAITGQPAFEGILEGWKYGPVSPEVNKIYNRKKFSVKTKDISDKLKYIINNVILEYGSLASWKLSEISHKETSWLNSRQGLKNTENGSNPLKLSDIREDAKKIRPYDHVWDMYYDEFEDYDDQEKKS